MNNHNADSQTRLSLIIAIVLTAFGFLRFISDMLTDASSDWYQMLDGTFLRYLIRAPSDGTIWGDINVQWVKILAIPCGISGLFLAYRLLIKNRQEAQNRWQMPEIQALYVIGLLVMCTVMEIEKATHFFGLRMAGLLIGERAWLNHTLHLISALIGWRYMRWLRLLPKYSSTK